LDLFPVLGLNALGQLCLQSGIHEAYLHLIVVAICLLRYT